MIRLAQGDKVKKVRIFRAWFSHFQEQTNFVQSLQTLYMQIHLRSSDGLMNTMWLVPWKILARLILVGSVHCCIVNPRHWWIPHLFPQFVMVGYAKMIGFARILHPIYIAAWYLCTFFLDVAQHVYISVWSV